MHRNDIHQWWLAVTAAANTPNWDIASTCQIKGKRGLLLIEAKAHTDELTCEGCAADNLLNKAQISAAVAAANSGLAVITGTSWGLSSSSHYQLANRFALSWKSACLGYPTVLIYLGVLNAHDMLSNSPIFTDMDSWRAAVLSYSQGIVPHNVWDGIIDVNGVPLIPAIRAMESRTLVFA
jgi:hypothetical protein